MKKIVTVRTNKPSESWPKALVVLQIFKYGLNKRFKEVRQNFKDEVKMTVRNYSDAVHSAERTRLGRWPI